MLFCTQRFLLFFAAVFILYWSIPRRRPKVWLLLVASFYFYSCWNQMLAVLIFATASFDFLIGRGLQNLEKPVWRKLLLAFSLVMNLGLLVYFKYANFFLQSLQDALREAGATSSLPLLQVVLPVGISFYTFEAISYTVDVYRRKIAAEKSLDHFLLFILFFPHLVAGPIVRPGDFLPQVRRPKRLSWPRLLVGGQYILLGMFKKMAIADRMALLVDPVFADSGSYSTGILWMAAVAYAFQVYCDFSGYSDLALGTAHLLGYRLAINFNLPFSSLNYSEFWRRWHISLSNWIRDYIFFPLGGSRGSEWRTTRNLLVAFTLCGLWHGAKWNFVLWGFLNGLFLMIHRGFRQWGERRPHLDGVLKTAGGSAMRVALTFTAFTVSVVVFRNSTLASAAEMIGRMFTPHAGLGSPIPLVCFWVTVLVMLLAHLWGRWDRSWQWWGLAPAPVQGMVYASVVIVALMLAPAASQAFIYFQF